MAAPTVISQIKQRLWLMRNGVVSDALRRAGSPFEIVLGVNLPQMVEIAGDFAPDVEVAMALWQSTKVREHHLIAPMLYPREQLTPEHAAAMMATAQTIEGADILCHRLLRHCPFASQLANEAFAHPQNQMQAYAALRLARNLGGEQQYQMARAALEAAPEANVPLTALARTILEDLEF